MVTSLCLSKAQFVCKHLYSKITGFTRLSLYSLSSQPQIWGSVSFGTASHRLQNTTPKHSFPCYISHPLLLDNKIDVAGGGGKLATCYMAKHMAFATSYQLLWICTGFLCLFSRLPNICIFCTIQISRKSSNAGTSLPFLVFGSQPLEALGWTRYTDAVWLPWMPLPPF